MRQAKHRECYNWPMPHSRKPVFEPRKVGRLAVSRPHLFHSGQETAHHQALSTSCTLAWWILWFQGLKGPLFSLIKGRTALHQTVPEVSALDCYIRERVCPLRSPSVEGRGRAPHGRGVELSHGACRHLCDSTAHFIS